MLQWSRRWRKLLVHNILHADDTPHAIALGVGIATFIAFLPLIGLQTLVSVALAAAFRANKAVCIPVVWITNPVTMVPIYGACMTIGGYVTGHQNSEHRSATLAALSRHEGFGRILEPGFWGDLLRVFLSFGIDLWVGSAVVAAVLAVLGYFSARWGVVHYRERRRRHKLQRELFRAERRAVRLAAQRGGAPQ